MSYVRLAIILFNCVLLASIGRPNDSPDEDTIEHHGYSIMTEMPDKKVHQDRLDVWICDQPSFYISTEGIRSDMQKLAYFDGKVLLTGFRKGNSLFGLMAFDSTKVPKNKNPEHASFYFSTMIFPCVYHPKANTKIYHYDFDVERMLNVKRVDGDAKLITYKSETKSLWFDKQTGRLRQFHVKEDGSDVTIIHENKFDVTGYNRRIIQRMAKESLGVTIENGLLKDEYEHKDDVLVDFAKKQYR